MHGQAVLFIGGNSEGIHAARHWQVVRSNCSLVESQGCIYAKNIDRCSNCSAWWKLWGILSRNHWLVARLFYTLLETQKGFMHANIQQQSKCIFPWWKLWSVYAGRHWLVVKLCCSLMETVRAFMQANCEQWLKLCSLMKTEGVEGVTLWQQTLTGGQAVLFLG